MREIRICNLRRLEKAFDTASRDILLHKLQHLVRALCTFRAIRLLKAIVLFISLAKTAPSVFNDFLVGSYVFQQITKTCLPQFSTSSTLYE